ncbi:hypothetical protein C8J56DRAFT_1170576 [Mycena floridula]|nr:hypothetical protein C8J56DRAFT_1170576 [Mycena floridula]
MASREPFDGKRRKLVIGFDIGTTFSGISYSVLDPGIVPEIKSVTRFPAQEHVGGDAKIPSIIYYDAYGKVGGVGAEALELKESIIENGQEDKWHLAEWFKLHMRPSSDNMSQRIPSLPPNKTVTQVFADFLAYLFRCAQTYIQESHPNGIEFWESFGNEIDFVLTHPNGWEGAQQGLMRQAATMAGLIPDSDDGHVRLQFVTEGEASLHFCVHNGLSEYASKPDEGVIIVDAGGGTIDISTYSSDPDFSFREIAVPECHFKGSIFVTREAKAFLQRKLAGSKFADDLENIVHCFDHGAKMRFKSQGDPTYVKFGSMRDKDPALEIRSGQLKLYGPDVAQFFEPSIAAICETVQQQRRSTLKKITSIFLVGGFAASEYVFSQLQERLSIAGLTFCRPDSHVNKAVADGAVSFYLDHFVKERVAKLTYGVECNMVFNELDPDHTSRRYDMYVNDAGEQRLPHHFDVILPKGTLVSESTEFVRHYNITSTSKPKFRPKELLCYRGRDNNPKWIDIDSSMYSTVCEVSADVSKACQTLVPQKRTDGGTFYRFHYQIILLFGLTELKAMISWKENGVEKRSPAKIIYT